jgi:hypothetical protein
VVASSPFCLFSALGHADVIKCVLVSCECVIFSVFVVYSGASYSGVVVLRSQSNRSMSRNPC